MQCIHLVLVPDVKLQKELESYYSISQELKIISSMDEISEIQESFTPEQILTLILIDKSELHPDSHFKDSNIILPNCFIDTLSPPIFLENLPWEEYETDLFSLYSYGICSSSNNSKETYDVYNPESYGKIFLLWEKGFKNNIYSIHYFSQKVGAKIFSALIDILISQDNGWTL